MNGKTNLLITLLIFCSALLSFAQTGYQDVVYLKNGSIIRGVIIEQKPNESIKIETRDKNVFVFKMDEVEKIAKEKSGNQKEKVEETKEPVNTGPYTGFSFTIETHIGPGVGNEANQGMTMGVHAINGVMINGIFTVGGGLGFDLVNAYSDAFLVMDYFIDARFHPLRGKVTPVLVTSFGYATDLFSSRVTGGVKYNVGVGTKINFNRRSGLSLTVNYRQQNLYYVEDYYSGSLSGTQYFRYIGITFAVTF